MPTRQQAVNHVRAGKNVIIATSSASGKSLVYNIAVMQAMLTEPATRALYLFPTKALAQDQLRKLHELFSPALLPAADARHFRRRYAAVGAGGYPEDTGAIILTNPDMLHVGIMPNHQSWASSAAPPEVRGRGRSPYLPRRFRLARRLCSAPPAPPLPALWLRPAVYPLHGHRRQSRRARCSV